MAEKTESGRKKVVRELSRLAFMDAERYKLGVFGGSDFHSEKYGIPLGTFYCPPYRTADLILSLTEK